MTDKIQFLTGLARTIRFRGYPIPFLSRRYIRWIGEHLGYLVARDGICLDIGSGTSPYRREIVAGFQIGQYIACDIAPSDSTTIVGDARRLPLRPESVSLIVALEVLQHISNVHRALDEMYRVLIPGGLLLVSFPFIFGECDVVDFRRWSLQGMEDEIRQRGFEVIHAQRRGGAFFAVASALHWTAQHIIPGARKSWRFQMSGMALARSAIVLALTVPTAIIAWLALLLDGLLPPNGLYMGGLMLARRTTHVLID